MKGKDFVYENFFKEKKTIDIGCGEGEFTARAPKYVTGIDMNPDAIQRMKQKGLNAMVGSAMKLPFADNSFEGAYCRNIIEHLSIEDAISMLCEMERVVCPGGTIMVASEVVTKRFWDTFGHTKPYPPEAIIKVMRPFSHEKFKAIPKMNVECVVYLGQYFKSKILYALLVTIAYYLPILRREFFLVLSKPL
jgi:ubiquinone/menaquinone biosynthesis C-methylase UbiE